MREGPRSKVKASSEVSEGRESEKAVERVASQTTVEAEPQDATASVWSLSELRRTSEAEGTETGGCWRSERERRGKVTKPDSRPEERVET